MGEIMLSCYMGLVVTADGDVPLFGYRPDVGFSIGE